MGPPMWPWRCGLKMARPVSGVEWSGGSSCAHRPLPIWANLARDSRPSSSLTRQVSFESVYYITFQGRKNKEQFWANVDSRFATVHFPDTETDTQTD